MTTITKPILIIILALLSFVQPVSAQQENPAFSQAELDQMLAPIALYPDVLLSQILVASTYPLEIVEAARWLQANQGLEGEQAVAAVENHPWDPSVKALVAFPQVLMRMNDDLNWTQALGDAFLFQEAQVMDSVQGLRQRAHEAGNLNSTENARVIRDDRIIVIEPANPQVVYVPYYDPRVIYGSWWWPGFAPVFWGPPPGIHFNLGFNWGWGRGVFVTPGFFYSSFDWYRRHTVVVHRHHTYHYKPHFRSGRHVRYSGYPRWQHNAHHRRGVAYRHDSLQRQFGASRRSGDGHAGTRSSRDRNAYSNFNHTNRSHSNRRNQGWSHYAATQDRSRHNDTQTARSRNDRSDADRSATRDRWRNENDSGNRTRSSRRDQGGSHYAATQDRSRHNDTQTERSRDDRSDADRSATRDRWRNESDSGNRTRSGRRDQGGSAYASTQNRFRNDEGRPTYENNRRRDNRSDADRITTRDRWRQSSTLSSRGAESNLRSRNSGAAAPNMTSRNTPESNGIASRNAEQRRASSSRRTSTDFSSNREAGRSPTRPRQDSSPSRDRTSSPRVRQTNVTESARQNRRAYTAGSTSPNVMQQRSQNQRTNYSSAARNESRSVNSYRGQNTRQSPSSASASAYRSGSSTGAGYRSSNSGRNYSGSANYSSGRSAGRGESSRSR